MEGGGRGGREEGETPEAREGGGPARWGGERRGTARCGFCRSAARLGDPQTKRGRRRKDPAACPASMFVPNALGETRSPCGRRPWVRAADHRPARRGRGGAGRGGASGRKACATRLAGDGAGRPGRAGIETERAPPGRRPGAITSFLERAQPPSSIASFQFDLFLSSIEASGFPPPDLRRGPPSRCKLARPAFRGPRGSWPPRALALALPCDPLRGRPSRFKRGAIARARGASFSDAQVDVWATAAGGAGLAWVGPAGQRGRARSQGVGGGAGRGREEARDVRTRRWRSRWRGTTRGGRAGSGTR